MEGVGEVFEGECFGHGSQPFRYGPSIVKPFWFRRRPAAVQEVHGWQRPHEALAVLREEFRPPNTQA